MDKKVLVINNATLQPTNHHLLIEEGYKVDVAHSSDTGLQKLGAQDYDIIFLQENY